MRLLLSILSIFLLSAALTPSLSQSGRTPAPAKNGMVVSSHYAGSNAGNKILQMGGNAVDAAIATAFALAVTLPSAGNIGGGGFLVYHGADGYVTCFNFREKAPIAATADMFLDEDGKIKDNSNHEGPLSVGVPGTVAGLWLAHQRLGKLPWKDLLTPAIELAENGFPSTWAMQGFLSRIQRDKQKYPTTAEVFLKNGKDLYEPGEIFKQPDLAGSLKRIQKEGRDGFYEGKTAKLFGDYMRKTGGLITEEDLAKYEAEEQPVIHGKYRGYDVYGMSPPSSGGIAVVEMLNMLEGFNLKEMGHNSALYLHVLTEAMRRAFADRAQFLGDPQFNPQLPLEKLTSKDYAKELRNSFDLFVASPSDSSKFNDAHLAFESEETTHFSVVDKAGNAVSLTYTLEYGYGSKLVVEGAGFLLNNEMGDFNPVPGLTNSRGLIGTKPNLVAPEKRMLSSMSPTIVAKEGKPVMVIGSPGGRTIINTTLQVILNVIDHGMNIAQAVEAPRIHHQWLPNITSFERYGISPDSEQLYQMRGHKIRFRRSQGSAMGIYIDQKTGIIYGAADSRAFDGKSTGY
jgi:gamma-glutamyltranspeptidase/glutathione hydrolase